MSRGRICDQCGTVLAVNRKGDDHDGESAAWMTLTTGDGSALDLCSRSCAHELLDDEDFVTAYEANVEAIVGIARVIRGDDDGDDDA